MTAKCRQPVLKRYNYRMTTRLPFTRASIKRAIAAVRESGLFVTGIRSDGTIMVSDKPEPQQSDVVISQPQDSKWSHLEV